MTREEALKVWLPIMDMGTENMPELKEALQMAVKALEQEPILDKIRAEIEDTGAYEQETMGKTEFLKGVTYCLGVIDKYKAESEDRNV